jgi:hypothetical protein
MAKRMKSKIQPAVQTLTFNFTPDGTVTYYLDLSQCASLVNRRFYRQGLNWAVAGMKMSTGKGTEGEIIINKLPNTWVMSNAWEKSFRAWQRMIEHATEDSGSESIKGKFLDYKILANKTHFDAKITGGVENLLPTSAYTTSWNTADPGQWDYSEVSIPNTIVGVPGDTEEYHLVAVGPLTAGSQYLSLIPGYANSRALPDTVDPNTPAGASTSENWLLQMFNDGNLQDTEVIDILENTGNNPPYPFEGDLAGNADTQYPGGENQLPSLEVHDKNYITTTTVGGSTYIKGGNFPCGLMELQFFAYAGTSVTLQIDLVPGTHRGYLAEPMTDM